MQKVVSGRKAASTNFHRIWTLDWTNVMSKQVGSSYLDTCHTVHQFCSIVLIFVISKTMHGMGTPWCVVAICQENVVERNPWYDYDYFH